MKAKTLLSRIFGILLTIPAVLAILALGLFITLKLSGAHRSDPADIRTYETDNPHISGHTAISAHRSGGGIMPEETMMAFRNCAENPDFSIDVFEFDLRMTSDGVLVLLHDDTLDRTSDAEAVFGETDVRPESKTYEELRRLNMGARFEAEDGSYPYAHLSGDAVPDDLRILRVEEVLDYLSSVGDYRYIIEIKNTGAPGKQGVDVLYRVLSERSLVDRVVLGTFHKEIGDYAGEHYPDLARGATEDDVISFYIAALLDKKDFDPPYSALQLPFTDEYLDMGINLATAQVINYAHKHNLAVQYWTVNDEEDMRYLCSVGADCIMTDYPDRLYRVMAEEGYLPAESD